MLTILANWPVQPEEIDIIKASWPAECEIVFASQHSSAEVLARAAEFDVIAGQLQVELLRDASRLQLMHVLGHGIDRLGEGEVANILRARAIPIARANPAAITISEFVLMSLIALNRRLIQVHEALAYRGDWSQDLLPGRLRGSLGGELHGTTLCVAGLGSIGQAIAERAKAFGMRVGALTRRPEKYDAAELGLAFVGEIEKPEAWLAQAQHVVIALPLNEGTKNFLNADRIAIMPRGAFMVNIGRAAMVDQSAMHAALASGQLAGAAIDVWPNEADKTYPSPHPIHHFNVIMTPHSCAITRESRVRALQMVGDNLHRLLRGAPVLNASSVDGEALLTTATSGEAI